MEASRKSGGGLWNTPGPRQYSNERVCVCARVFSCVYCLLWVSVMMQESRLTNLQKRRITNCLQSRLETPEGRIIVRIWMSHSRSPFSKEGTSLPLTFDSPSPAPPGEAKPVQKRLSARPGRRSAEACRSGDAYVRERFCPALTSRFWQEFQKILGVTYS